MRETYNHLPLFEAAKVMYFSLKNRQLREIPQRMVENSKWVEMD